MKLKCPVCGKRFERIMPVHKYCSLNCRVKAFRQRRRAERVKTTPR